MRFLEMKKILELKKNQITEYINKMKRNSEHEYADGLHYHYKCVLENVSEDIKNKMIEANDTVALKTHYPYYSGLEELIKKKG